MVFLSYGQYISSFYLRPEAVVVNTGCGDKSFIPHVWYATLTLQWSWSDGCLFVKDVYSTVLLVTRCLSQRFMGTTEHVSYLDAGTSFVVRDCPTTLAGTHTYDDSILVVVTQLPCALFRQDRSSLYYGM